MNHSTILSTPLSFIGWDSSQQLTSNIQEREPDKILIVVDPLLVKLGVIDHVIAYIQATGVPYDIYTDIIPEPTLETADNLVAFARDGRYALVVGIGGGSALDLAKLAAVFVGNEGNVSNYLNLSGTRKLQHKGIPKILIPTTSGTGSEVTDISVLALDQTKDVIAHPYLKADLAIVDPKLTVSVPPRVTADTGVDALTHAIEAYLSINSTLYSDAIAAQAIKLIGKALPLAVRNGNDKDARIAMSYGSYLAGVAFYNAGVGAVHALAYPLGGEFHIPHGASNAVMLPYVLAFIQNNCAGRLQDILYLLNDTVAQSTDEQKDAKKCVIEIAELVQDIGIPATLKDFDIPETALRSLAIGATKQKRLLSRCPMELDEGAIYKIYSAAFYGRVSF